MTSRALSYDVTVRFRPIRKKLESSMYNNIYCLIAQMTWTFRDYFTSTPVIFFSPESKSKCKCTWRLSLGKNNKIKQETYRIALKKSLSLPLVTRVGAYTFFSPASQQSIILIPWTFLVNLRAPAVRIFHPKPEYGRSEISNFVNCFKLIVTL